MTQKSNVITSCSISKETDTIISTILLPITISGLGIAYYLFYVKLTALPFIFIAALIFGFSCMGLIRMCNLRNHGTSLE